MRQRLVEEARQSPHLLSDLAGLEAYIAESYTARTFFEFLQNADDAGASRFIVRAGDDRLIVANDGRPFTAEDLEALCRSAASQKTRGENIGFRGIGFKSVVSVASSVYLISGDYRCEFSRDRTAALVPAASRVPLIRIPHEIRPDDPLPRDPAIAELQRAGYSCVFVLAGLDNDAVREEFDAFEPSTLLFLRHVSEVEISPGPSGRHRVRRDPDGERLWILSDGQEEDWSVRSRDGVTLAVPAIREGRQDAGASEAVVHAFLPTRELTGFQFKVNADVSTDPSRTRVILDERTANVITIAANLIGTTVRQALEAPDIGLFERLVPSSDLRLASMKRRSFATELAGALKRDPTIALDDYRLRPAWLNLLDFGVIARAAGLQPVPDWTEGVAGATEFLSYLGAREATLDELRSGLRVGGLTSAGAADVVGYLSQPGTPASTEGDDQLWVVDGVPHTLAEATREGKTLDGSFVDQVIERTGSRGALRRLIVHTGGEAAADALLGREARRPPPTWKVETPPVVQAGSLRRWRTAEQQVMSALVQEGWVLQDVSRQNLGYDLTGSKPDGKPAFVEVKSIVTQGQPIIITSNEEATARLQGSAYVVAIVREVDEGLQIALVEDPARTLTLARQCRQWVWECQTYPFEPSLVPFAAD